MHSPIDSTTPEGMRILDSETRYRTLFDGFLHGIVIQDAEGKIVSVNPVAERILGLTLSQMHDRTSLDPKWHAIQEDGSPLPGASQPAMLALRSGQPVEDVVMGVINPACGDIRWIQVSAAPLFRLGEDQPYQVMTTLVDITARRLTEDALRKSERSVRARLDTILTPEGDLGTLELSDILDVPAIQDLMNHFFSLTKIGIGIIDLKGQVLVATGWQDICTRYHRAHPEACRNCAESDRILSAGVKPGAIRMHKCKNHLWDIVTPIHVGERHVGNLFLGQFVFADEVPDIDVFRAQAQRFGFDEAEYLAALERIPRWRRETVEDVMGFYSGFATLISELSYSSLRLARALTERARSEDIMKLRLRLIDYSLTHSLEEVLAATLDEAEALTGSQVSFYHSLEDGSNASPLQTWSTRTMRRRVQIEGTSQRNNSADAGAWIACIQQRQPVIHNDSASVSRQPTDSEPILRELVVPVFRGSSIAAILGVGNKAMDYDQTDIDSIKLVADLAWDIAEQKRAQEQQRRLEVQLLQVQKMESLGSLAGGVAHDMNNVLGAILGLASANLSALSEDSPAYHAFDTISKAAIRGGQMVKSLLSFARQSPAEECELDVNTILREEVSLLERTTLAKVRLKMDLAPDLHPIQGDPSTLTHAFLNLCVNAVDAMSENGELILRTRNVDDDWIEVVVEDTGSGMSKRVLEKAMDPFFTTKEQGKGTGLGLSMVYGTVKAHRGQIEIQSEPGQGTLVRMRFPACKIGTLVAESPTEGLPESSQEALNVLLVDDDDLIQSAMQEVLEALGHNTTGVSSGEAALAKLEAGFEPDVVILDMNMPGWGGSGSLPRLRALRPALPVLLATGRADQAALDLIEAHPFVTLLSKPFSLKELKRHLEPYRRH